jgi:2-polyprenyl-6-methoxyphenol hydroxylase-like FAD-dependent oxidoreductase
MSGHVRIAVIGGGVAGAVMANFLLRKVALADVQVYESAPELSGRGLGIGLSRFALQALEQVIPSAVDMLKSDAGAVKIGASRIAIVGTTLEYIRMLC